ncbi:uncharacterized protein LOC110449683 [Mizuhopecten yessoensis]|uniref:uncharacterized protein LOC110449683 n=1 Tax=Mizuhopecten yessoensis TaxID=6573 RepID=UPI000B45EA63|nr:uncharacterized protein LOC110449683 [Mizuhopecten yessoensis]
MENVKHSGLIFYCSTSSHSLTDYELWRKIAEDKAHIEDQFSRKMLAWTASVRKELSNIQTYKDPHLTKSLEMELAFSNLRADQAERNSIAFTRLSRHLEREATEVSDEYTGRMMTYRHLLRTLSKASATCLQLQQKLVRKRAKLKEHLMAIARLDESKQGVAPELHGNVKDSRRRLDVATNKCRQAQQNQTSIVQEAKEQSEKLKASWILKEIQQSEFLVQEWRQCLSEKVTSLDTDDREYECGALKLSHSVSVHEMVERLAENKKKEFLIKELDVDTDISLSPPLSPVFSLTDVALLSGVDNDPVVRLDNTSDDRSFGSTNQDGRRVELEVNYHRPKTYDGVTNFIYESNSIEKIDCNDDRKVARCSGTSMKTFLPGNEFIVQPMGQGDCVSTAMQSKKGPVPRGERDESYHVVVTKDYRKRSGRDISIRRGQKLEVCSMAPRDGMLFGYKKCRFSGQEKGGYFPEDCVIVY